MAVVPDPAEIFRRAAEEGERRLEQPLLELASTAFIAGFTVVFGIAALGIAHAVTEPYLGEAAKIAGALAFAPGLVFLIVGRTELFTENFSDPIASVFERREAGGVVGILRLWGATFVINLIGGGLLALVVSVHGVLPEGTAGALSGIAERLVSRGAGAGFASAIVGGALVALLSFLVQATDGIGSRIALAYAVGFLLALGPFDHVIVTSLHVFLGLLFGAPVGLGVLAEVLAISTAGNLVGGVGLVALSHVAQAKGAGEPGDGQP